jgi:PAS domain S-box-containing protein
MELDFHKDSTILGGIVDAMAVGVFTVDAAGRFVAWSDGAARITGYLRCDVIGQPCHILEGPNCRGFGSITDLLHAVTPPANGLCDQECKVLSKDGREVHIHGSVRLLFESDGKIAGAVGSFMDVSSLVHANEKIAMLEQQAGLSSQFEQLIGQSPSMRDVYRRLKLAADSEVAVLVTGESGTGKELAAKAIHRQSRRRDKPFLAINCSAIPEPLLESELFGHVRGAFTGATSDKVGLFEAADQGTLFLDEIGDVSPAVQVKLLRVLQEHEVRRIGDNHTRPVDVRLITATNKDLRKLLANETLREDFYYRIHVFEIHLPPLRQRKEDIPLLVDHFLTELCHHRTSQPPGVSRDAMQQLMEYDWPGNVRELRNAMEHACVTLSGDRVTYLDLPPEVRMPRGTSAIHQQRTPLSTDEATERDQIVAALKQTGGNRTKAAEMLGTSRVTLWKKINKYSIDATG